jgi:hypothetical protein
MRSRNNKQGENRNGGGGMGSAGEIYIKGGGGERIIHPGDPRIKIQ